MSIESSRIFLRIAKPSNPTSSKLLQFVDSQTVCLRREHYKYARVYHEESSQRDVYLDFGASQVQHLFKQLSSLNFVAGDSGSGNRYTLHGDGSWSNAGLLQHSLRHIFSMLRKQSLAPLCVFKSTGKNSYAVRCGAELLAAREHEAVRRGLSDLSQLEQPSKLQDPLPLKTPPAGDRRYAVFMSCFQLHHNSFHDLLEPDCDNYERLPKPHMMCHDSVMEENYISGLQEQEIRSEAEGMQLLAHIKRQRIVNQRLLNLQSSNTHIIYIISLLKTAQSDVWEPVDPPGIEVSRLIYVELAAQEQLLGSAKRQLDNSMVWLEKCLEQQRRGQTPTCRESKLTQLFSKQLSQGKRVNVLVCAQPCLENCEQHFEMALFADLLCEKTAATERSRAASKPCTVKTPIDVPRINCLDADELAEARKLLERRIGQRKLQQDLLRERETNMYQMLAALSNKLSDLNIDNSALISSYQQQQNRSRCLATKMMQTDQISKNTLKVMSRKCEEVDALKAQLDESAQIVDRMTKDLAVASDRRRKLRYRAEERMQNLTDKYTRRITALQVQVELMERRMPQLSRSNRNPREPSSIYWNNRNKSVLF